MEGHSWQLAIAKLQGVSEVMSVGDKARVRVRASLSVELCLDTTKVTL